MNACTANSARCGAASWVARVRTGLALSVAAAVFTALLAPSSIALAQKDGQRPPPETRKTNALRKRPAEKLSAVQELIQAEKYNEALAGLRAMVDSESLTDYETAVVNQFFGYAYVSLEKYKDALKYFDKAISAKMLAVSAELNLMFTAAQLYRATDELDKSIRTFEDWLARTEEPTGSQLYQVASTYAQAERFKQAISYAQKAVALSPTPEEGWLNLLASVYLNERQFKNAIEPLEELVLRFPKLSYYKQLAVAYSESKQEKKALVAFELAYRQGLMKEGRDLRRLAEQYLYHEVPYKAALLLASEIDSGRVEKSEDNWYLLATAWFQSRETEKAIAPMRRAAELAKSGKNYFQLGKILLDLERWQEAEEALGKAVEKGGIDRSDVQLHIGIALFGRGQNAQARRTFDALRSDKDFRERAQQWIRYIEDKERAERAGSAAE